MSGFPDVRTAALPDVLTPLGKTPPRRLALVAHQRLRELILRRAFPPGTVLKQAEVARRLGVSRTPVREAFRMLQEEGLIAAEPDQRATVVGLDIYELDAAYASRILLECLAVRMTTATIEPAGLDVLDDAISRMHMHRQRHRTSPEWAQAHRDFHRRTIAGAGTELMKEVQRLMDRTHQYLRLAQLGTEERGSAAERGHRRVVEAMRLHAQGPAAIAMAEHLADTARHLVAQVAPGHELLTVAAAISMVDVGATRDTAGGSSAREHPEEDDNPARRRSWHLPS